jgi:hypothetical protein
MKKLLTAKYLSLFMLLSLLGGKVEAGHHEDDDYVSESRGGCCFGNQYECGCNPLYCGAFDVQVQGGVDPIIWTNRGPIYGVTTAGVVDEVYLKSPKFSKLFKTPWYVGGQIGYAMSDNTRVYVEFNYSQANGKSDVALVTDFSTAITGTFTFGKFSVFDAYVGARYYWDRWCDRVSFFLGGKVGLAHHKRTRITTGTFVGTATNTFTDQEIFSRNTIIAGGANFGIDICICGNWSFVITGEVVANCPPRGFGNVPLTTTVSTFTNLIFNSPAGTELRFPVTAAVRYSF